MAFRLGATETQLQLVYTRRESSGSRDGERNWLELGRAQLASQVGSLEVSPWQRGWDSTGQTGWTHPHGWVVSLTGCPFRITRNEP